MCEKTASCQTSYPLGSSRQKNYCLGVRRRAAQIRRLGPTRAPALAALLTGKGRGMAQDCGGFIVRWHSSVDLCAMSVRLSGGSLCSLRSRRGLQEVSTQALARSLRAGRYIDVSAIQSLRRSVGYTVDLVLCGGGSPCQDLAPLLADREGLAGSRSKLFYEMPRIFDSLRQEFECPVPSTHLCRERVFNDAGELRWLLR